MDHKFTVVKEKTKVKEDGFSHDVVFVQPSDHYYTSLYCDTHKCDIAIMKPDHVLICGQSCINAGASHSCDYDENN